MRKWLLGTAIALIGLALAVPEADARRLGGARSSGVQRSVAPPPAKVPAKPAQAQPAQQPAQAAPGAAAAGSGSRWAPILGGLAIGGLLATMFGSGLGSLILSVLVIGLLAFAAVFLLRLLAQKRVGDDRPAQFAAEGPRMDVTGMGGQPPASLPGGHGGATTAVPAGFDEAGFLKGARRNFLRLQVANDTGNVEELREFTTPEMFAELKRDLASRSGARQHTDVVQLDADLLEVATEGSLHWASVRFSGLIAEAPGQAAEPFEEVWSLCKPVDGTAGWVLAGIQQLH